MTAPAYPFINGVGQYPTGPERLAALDDVAGQLSQSLGRRLASLEIGSLFGDSVKILAHHGTAVCIDPWPYGMVEFLENTKGLPVIPMRGSSQEVIPFLREQQFDLIYVDGSHFYSDVGADLVRALMLVKTPGVICGDDLERVIGESLGRSQVLLDGLAIDYVNNYHPGVTLAVHDFLGEVNVKDGFWWKEIK